MNAVSLRYAERGVQLLQAALQRQPPPGVSAQFVGSFFLQFGPSLTGELAKLLDSAWALRQPRELAPPPPLVLEGMPPDEWPAAARTAANITAIELIASGAPLGPSERSTLLRYSGWGGLSLDAVASRIPPGWLPETRGPHPRVLHAHPGRSRDRAGLAPALSRSAAPAGPGASAGAVRRNWAPGQRLRGTGF